MIFLPTTRRRASWGTSGLSIEAGQNFTVGAFVAQASELENQFQDTTVFSGGVWAWARSRCLSRRFRAATVPCSIRRLAR